MTVTVGTFLPIPLGVPAFAAAGALAAAVGIARGGPLLAAAVLFLALDLPAGQWFHWGVGVLLGLVAGAVTRPGGRGARYASRTGSARA